MPIAKTIIAPSLLDPGNHALILIDHQYLRLLTVRPHEATAVIGAATLLAKSAKLFGVRTLITTVLAARQAVAKEIQEVFPALRPIDRTTLNPFEDERVVFWAGAAGRGKLVLAGHCTETSVAMTALSALSAGYEVYVVSDASSGASTESHEMAMERMIAAGAVPLTAGAYLKELQRDWARDATAAEALAIIQQHGGGYGEFGWEIDVPTEKVQ
jgi:nicotinamidase-related amidase